MKTLGVHYQTMRRFIRDERAVTAVEYALIAAGLAVAILVAVNTLGTTLTATYNAIAQAL